MDNDARPSLSGFLLGYAPFALLGSGYCAAQIAGYSGLPTHVTDALAFGLASMALLPAILGATWFADFATETMVALRESDIPQKVSFGLIAILYTMITTRAIVLTRGPDEGILTTALLSLHAQAWTGLEDFLRVQADYGGPLFVALAVVLLLVLLHSLHQSPEEASGLRLWVEPAGWFLLCLLNPVFDLSAPLLAAFVIASLLIIAAHSFKLRYPDMLPNWVYTLVIPATFSFGQPFADTMSKLFLLNAFIVLVWTTLFLGTKIIVRHRLLVIAVTISMCQLAASTWSISQDPPREANLITSSQTNAYCQDGDGGLIWLAHPGCSSLATNPTIAHSFESCRDATLTRISDVTFEPEFEMMPFAQGQPGRIHTITCTDNTLWASFTRAGLPPLGTSTLSLLLDPIGQPHQDVMGPGVGNSLVADHDTGLLYVAERQSNTVHRYHYPTQTKTELQTASRANWIIASRPDQAPPRLILADGDHGQWLAEISADPEAPVAERSVPLNNILATGITVAEEAGHLFVSGPWTLDRYDLTTFEHKRRVRTTAGSSAPVYIAQHDLVIVASELEGTIRVYDAENLTLVQIVDVGLGATAPFMTQSGHLIASNGKATFSWPLHNFLTRDDT